MTKKGSGPGVETSALEIPSMKGAIKELPGRKKKLRMVKPAADCAEGEENVAVWLIPGPFRITSEKPFRNSAKVALAGDTIGRERRMVGKTLRPRNS
jgi:hypothetical protein